MDKLLTDREVARYLGMHIKTLQKLLRENKIALNFIQMDHRILSRPADVERYFDSLTVIRDGSGTNTNLMCHRTESHFLAGRACGGARAAFL
jgi:hypothetical protein